MKNILNAAFLITVAYFVFACQLAPPPQGQIMGSTVGMTRLAVFGLEPDPGLESSITPEALSRLNESMIAPLIEKKYLPIPPGQIRGTRAAILARDINVDLKKLIKDVGEAHNAQAVLIGNIYRFREKMAKTSSPASVGMTLKLINVKTGDIIWRGTYDETQKSVLENLLSVSRLFKKRLKWSTAGEMAADGLGALLKSVPPPGFTPEK